MNFQCVLIYLDVDSNNPDFYDLCCDKQYEIGKFSKVGSKRWGHFISQCDFSNGEWIFPTAVGLFLPRFPPFPTALLDFGM